MAQRVVYTADSPAPRSTRLRDARGVELHQAAPAALAADRRADRLAAGAVAVELAVLEVDAVLRDGDADGPLLVAVADFKRMLGFDAANACVASLRRAGRTEVRDGVEYVAFAMWQPVES